MCVANKLVGACIVFILALTPNLFAKGGGSGRSSGGSVHVSGYTRKDGTYVAPYYRSAPDGTKANNWSTKGNVNPYTGEPGTKNPNSVANPGSSEGQGSESATTPTASTATTEANQQLKSETDQKVLEWQKKRAGEDSPSAQYDLAVRYLTGNGVAKDIPTAIHWFDKSRQNGNSQAAVKLTEIRKTNPHLFIPIDLKVRYISKSVPKFVFINDKGIKEGETTTVAADDHAYEIRCERISDTSVLVNQIGTTNRFELPVSSTADGALAEPVGQR